MSSVMNGLPIMIHYNKKNVYIWKRFVFNRLEIELQLHYNLYVEIVKLNKCIIVLLHCPLQYLEKIETFKNLIFKRY